MKRFWAEVTIGDDRVVMLDGKPVRTPGRVPLALPTAALAQAVAQEWRAVGEIIDPRAMPLTGLSNAAIDRIAPDRTAFAAGLAKYAQSDLLCYRAETPAPLVERQAAAWDPVIGWAQSRYDVHLVVTAGIVHRSQPPATLARLGEAVAALDAWHLAGLSPLVTVSGSLLLGLAALERAIAGDALWGAAEVDEEWQADQWGRDPLAEAARDGRRAEIAAGLAFLAALSVSDGG